MNQTLSEETRQQAALSRLSYFLGEPNNVGDEACLEFYTAEGLWNDVSCNYHRGYICEKDDLQP